MGNEDTIQQETWWQRHQRHMAEAREKAGYDPEDQSHVIECLRIPTIPPEDTTYHCCLDLRMGHRGSGFGYDDPKVKETFAEASRVKWQTW